MDRREVITKCMEMGVPIFQGRIDKTLFLASLKDSSKGRGTGRPRPRSLGRAVSAHPRLSRRSQAATSAPRI